MLFPVIADREHLVFYILPDRRKGRRFFLMFKNKNIKSTILSLFLAFGMIAAFLLGVDVKKEFLSDESTALESLQEEIDNTLEKGFCIYFLDVGQADAALVECDGHYMMIDVGNAADSGKIYTILKEKQIDYLDLLWILIFREAVM